MWFSYVPLTFLRGPCPGQWWWLAAIAAWKIQEALNTGHQDSLSSPTLAGEACAQFSTVRTLLMVSSHIGLAQRSAPWRAFNFITIHFHEIPWGNQMTLQSLPLCYWATRVWPHAFFLCTLASKEGNKQGWLLYWVWGKLAPAWLCSWSGMSTSGILIPTDCSRGCLAPCQLCW